MSKIKSFPISTYFWTATIISLLPAIIFLGLDASDWPNNWDDFQRLFNGISQEHKVIGYGIEASNAMMKLALFVWQCGARFLYTIIGLNTFLLT